MILEFTTQAEAQACLDAINTMAIQYWTDQGYTVENGELISKNAATGEDEPHKQRTTTWAVIKESPDGTFYFKSLTGTPYAAGMEQLTGFSFTEKEFPQEWVEEDIV